MKLKLIHVTPTSKQAYYFNEADSQLMLTRCKQAGKQWSHALLGFFINVNNDYQYAAITIKGQDGIIESMEYVDIDTNKPEFVISPDLLAFLQTQPANSEIPLSEFESLFEEIIVASVKARRWEVYPEVSRHYPLTH